MLKVVRHWGNANQSHNGIPLHKDGDYHKNRKSAGEDVGKWEPCVIAEEM